MTGYLDDPRYAEMLELLAGEGFTSKEAKQIAADVFVRRPSENVDSLIASMRAFQQRHREGMN